MLCNMYIMREIKSLLLSPSHVHLTILGLTIFTKDSFSWWPKLRLICYFIRHVSLIFSLFPHLNSVRNHLQKPQLCVFAPLAKTNEFRKMPSSWHRLASRTMSSGAGAKGHVRAGAHVQPSRPHRTRIVLLLARLMCVYVRMREAFRQNVVMNLLALIIGLLPVGAASLNGHDVLSVAINARNV